MRSVLLTFSFQINLFQFESFVKGEKKVRYIEFGSRKRNLLFRVSQYTRYIPDTTESFMNMKIYI